MMCSIQEMTDQQKNLQRQQLMLMNQAQKLRSQLKDQHQNVNLSLL
jgi:hypothetical protein